MKMGKVARINLLVKNASDPMKVVPRYASEYEYCDAVYHRPLTEPVKMWGE